MPMKVELRVH